MFVYTIVTSCLTGFTTGCILYTNIQPVVKLVWQPVVSCIQPVVKQVVQAGLTTGWTNSGCSFNMVVKLVWQPVVSCKRGISVHTYTSCVIPRLTVWDLSTDAWDPPVSLLLLSIASKWHGRSFIAHSVSAHRGEPPRDAGEPPLWPRWRTTWSRWTTTWPQWTTTQPEWTTMWMWVNCHVTQVNHHLTQMKDHMI